jgi:hypothetical protein
MILRDFSNLQFGPEHSNSNLGPGSGLSFNDKCSAKQFTGTFGLILDCEKWGPVCCEVTGDLCKIKTGEF